MNVHPDHNVAELIEAAECVLDDYVMAIDSGQAEGWDEEAVGESRLMADRLRRAIKALT